MPEFQVRKHNPSEIRIVSDTSIGAIEPGEGEVVVKLDRFAFTANNITYARVGESLRYWDFFPAACDPSNEWGVIPVWGFAEVVTSKVDNVPVGERLFGYFPPSTFLKMKPVDVSETRWVDGMPHRTELPVGYNSYSRVLANPKYDRAMDNEQMLFFPLHATSYCLYDFILSNDWFGAQQVVIVSASSKTSIGLAYALIEDASGPQVVGITSSRNSDVVKSFESYHSVLTYEELPLDRIDKSLPTVIVDMSGNGEILGQLHAHLGDEMKHCARVGLTHWDESQRDPRIIEDRSEMFFAPGHIQTIIKERGIKAFERESAAFIRDKIIKCRRWLKLTTLAGPEGLAEVFDDVDQGRISPDQGLIIEM